MKRFSLQIKKLFRGERKTLLTNFFSLSLLQIAGYIFPLLTVPYLANVIGIEHYGEIAFAMAVMIYFQTVIDYGFIFSAVRDIARCKTDIARVSQIYSTVMWSRCLLLIISFFILILLILLIPKFMEIRWVLIVSFMMVVGHTLFPDWIFQALEKMKYVTIFNVLVKLIFTIAVFAFIRIPSDYLLQPLFSSLGYIISGIGSMILINKWGIRISTPKFNDIIFSLKKNFDLFINQIVPNLYNSASVLLLGVFHGDAANGIYDAANRFNIAGGSLFSIISRTFFPFLSRKIERHNIFVRINIICAISVSTMLFIFSPFIIRKFFPSDFAAAIDVLRILSISIIFWALTNIFGTNYLIIKGYEQKMRQITLYSSLLGLLIGLPLVYFYSYIGVALTVTISRFIMGTWSMFTAKKIQKKC